MASIPLLSYFDTQIVNSDEFRCQPAMTCYERCVCTTQFLHKSVDNNEAVNTISKLYKEHNREVSACSFNAEDIEILLNAVLASNIFRSTAASTSKNEA